MEDAAATPQAPQPDPALRELDFLVGRWSMRGHLGGSDEENIVGEASYEWLPGGLFMRQRIKLDFAGFVQVHSEELIGYDPASGKFKSQVYSNMSPEPLPYELDVRGGQIPSPSPTARWTRPSPAGSARTATASPAAGGPTPARTRPRTSRTTSPA